MGCLQQQQDDPFEDQMRNMFIRMHEAMKSVEAERDALRSKCEELQIQVFDGHAKLKAKRTEVKKLSKTCQTQEEELRKSAVLLAIVTHHADELERQVSKLSKWQVAKKRLERRVQKLTKDREELTAILIKALEKKKEVEVHAKRRKKKLQEDYSALSTKVDYLESELEDRKSYIYLIEGELDKYMQQVVSITNDEENYEDDDEPEMHKEQGGRNSDLHELVVAMSFDSYADITPATSAETDPEITKQPKVATASIEEEPDAADYLEEDGSSPLNVATLSKQSNIAVSAGMELALSKIKSFNRDVENRKENVPTTTANNAHEENDQLDMDEEGNPLDREDINSLNQAYVKTPRRRNKGRSMAAAFKQSKRETESVNTAAANQDFGESVTWITTGAVNGEAANWL